MSNEKTDAENIERQERYEAAKARERLEVAKGRDEATTPPRDAPALSFPAKATGDNADKGTPGYIGFLHFFAGLNLLVGVFALIGLVIVIIGQMNRPSYSSPSSPLAWLVPLALAIEGFLAFGLLSAVADIAKNMIDVGAYVRHLKAKEERERKADGKD